MKKKTQNEAVMEYMTEHGSITAMQAMKDLGVMRLASRIWDLNNSGQNIECDHVRAATRYGTVTYIAKYRLKDDREYQNT